MSRLRRAPSVIARWLLGTVLVTWRYLWETTPFYRNERPGDERDRPPDVPSEIVDEQVQLPADGCGPMFHRRFWVHIAAPQRSAAQLIEHVAGDFKHFVPSEVVDIHGGGDGARQLRVGDEMLVEMPGPWNGPVRIAHRDDTSLHLVTLRGHLEAGQVRFRAHEHDGTLAFEIELWARAASRLVDMLYSRLRFAKEVQLNMWVRFCMAAVSTSGGRLVDGVHISTRRLDTAGEPHRSPK